MSDGPAAPTTRDPVTVTTAGRGVRRSGPGWLSVVAMTAIGVTGGMAVNGLRGPMDYEGLVSDTPGYRHLATASTIVAVLSATIWLYRLGQPRLPRYIPQALLALAAAAAVWAAAEQGRPTAVFTGVSAVLTLDAVVLAIGTATAGTLLAGVATIGGGVTLIGLAMALGTGKPAVLILTVLAVAVVGFGLGTLADYRVLAGMALIAVGLAATWLGRQSLLTNANPPAAAAAYVWFGLAAFGLGVARLATGHARGGVILIGMAFIVFGADFPGDGGRLDGTAFIAFGVAVVGSTAAIRSRVRQQHHPVNDHDGR